MPIEVDEARYAALEGAEKLLNTLLNNKDTGAEQHKLIKKVHPAHQVPIDPETVVAEARAAAKAELAERERKERDAMVEKKFQDDLNSYRLSDSNPNGFTDEGIEKIVGLMKDRTIPDVHAAVALWRQMHPVKPEPPSGYVPMGWNFGNADKDDEKKKLLLKDPDRFLDLEAREVFEEYRRMDRQ